MRISDLIRALADVAADFGDVDIELNGKYHIESLTIQVVDGYVPPLPKNVVPLYDQDPDLA